MKMIPGFQAMLSQLAPSAALNKGYNNKGLFEANNI
jgi:hypothetical protein